MKRLSAQPSDYPPIRLAISACLLGQAVRYDGGHKLDTCVRDLLGPCVEWIAVCPEVGCGMPAPREPMDLVGTPQRYRLLTVQTRIDQTQLMQAWIDEKLQELSEAGIWGFVCKSRSPSCALSDAAILSARGAVVCRGSGLFTGALVRRFPDIAVEDEQRLHDESVREQFIERLFTLARWREFAAAGPSLRSFVRWHSDHKLLLMAHCPDGMRKLGKIVAGAKGSGLTAAVAEYFRELCRILTIPATRGGHVNALQHAAGYFKRQLTAQQKSELGECIGGYGTGEVPLLVPITLINHHARTFGQPYLEQQVYLHPCARELRMRYHS